MTACGDEDPPAEEDAGDGKVHPAPNGVHTTETAACDALVNAYEARRAALACTGTTRTCPGYLRVQVSGTACLEYDQGSVDGCIAYYQEQPDCESLAQASDICIVTSYPGTEPAGCP